MRGKLGIPDRDIRKIVMPVLACALALVLPAPGAGQEGAVATPDEAFADSIMQLYRGGEIPERFRAQVDSFISEKLEWERDKIVAARRVIDRTNRTALAGTVIVHLAVIVGFVLAVLEFSYSRRLRREGGAVQDHEVRIGLEGVAVKTSLYGLLILFVATGLYLMYLKFVYPIQVIGP